LRRSCSTPGRTFFDGPGDPPWSRLGATSSDTRRMYTYLVEQFFGAAVEPPSRATASDTRRIYMYLVENVFVGEKVYVLVIS
jgi:hypothetical protein